MIQRVTISLPQNLTRKAKELAKRNGATFSGFIRLALEKEIFECEKAA